jgi:uncharacterized SAM-binding protein YcdF (DUF218 family)
MAVRTGAPLTVLVLASLALLFGTCLFIGWFFDRRRPPSSAADVALVFGCGAPWKSESRLNVALDLYRRGLAPHLIVTGGVRMPGRAVTEAEWFRDWLVREGVPPERIHLEMRATNTAENVEYSLPILEMHGWRRVILVMSDFEGIRAHLTAKRAWRGRGVRLYDCHAPSGDRWHRWTWWMSRQGWALTWYTLPRLFRYRLLPYLWR